MLPTDSPSPIDLVGQIGVLSALRTGHAPTDLLIALMLPLLVKLAISAASVLGPACLAMMTSSRRKFPERVITVERHINSNNRAECVDSEKRNHILAKALQMYISKNCLNMDLKNQADVSLMAIKEETQWDDYNYTRLYGQTASALGRYSITKTPMPHVWTALNENNLEFMINPHQLEHRRSDGDGNNNQGQSPPLVVKISYHLRCSDEKAIDALLDKAYAWYRHEMSKGKEDCRYLFTLAKTEDKTGPVYSRHKLSEEKTFASLFIPCKADLLALLDDFVNKRGKFAIPGVGQKLGLLLHGPPGTGKTSLIKALAAHTRRHIVSIPLSRLKTNRELSSMVFDLKFKVASDEDDPMDLSYKDIVFVIEDVDAASTIVQRRDSMRSSDSTDSAESSSSNNNNNLLLAAMLSQQQQQQQQQAPESKQRQEPDTWVSLLKKDKNDDELNLAGLLNVIDGIVDTPGRILILSTNHPERLDPALIRPGRVDRILNLDYCKLPEAREMTMHYFQTDKVDPRLDRVFEKGLKITPAEMERTAIASANVAAFLSELEAML